MDEQSDRNECHYVTCWFLNGCLCLLLCGTSYDHIRTRGWPLEDEPEKLDDIII